MTTAFMDRTATRLLGRIDTIEAMAADHETMEEHNVEDSRNLREIVIHLGYMRRDLNELKTGSATRLTKVESDIGNLQNFRWWVLGISAGLSLVGGVLGAVVALKAIHP